MFLLYFLMIHININTHLTTYAQIFQTAMSLQVS
jgi:hypothetical protein